MVAVGTLREVDANRVQSELRNVETPLAKSFLAIGGAICGEDFFSGGRTLASLGLGGLDREGLQKLLREGFAS